MSTGERHQEAIQRGEEAWQRASSGNWEESAWRVMGTALMLLREEVLYALHSNNPRGAAYNMAFGRRLASTQFKSMDAVTRSALLFCMVPENRVILDGLLARWTPSERARRTHPTTLAKALRAELKPKVEDAPQAVERDPLKAREFEQRVEAEVRRRLAVEADEIRRLRAENFHLQYYRGFFSQLEYKNLVICVHPDNSASVELRNVTLARLVESKPFITKPATKGPPLPDRAEMERNRARYDAQNRERAAKRAATRAARRARETTG